jgi:hypothetical protein
MKLIHLGGVVAAAVLAVPMLTSVASAAEQAPATPASASFGSDCTWTHYWDGYFHRNARLICDDTNYYGGYYYGPGYLGGGNFHRGGFPGGHRH